LICLCAKIQPDAINWDYVHQGNTVEERASNAKYAISLARKFGAAVHCSWEDIVSNNKKMILIYVASLYDLYLQN
jgi:plastin-1